MSNESILKNLKDRFSAPLPEFHKRHIVFWHDEEQKFVDDIDEIDLEGVKLLTLTGKNNFYAKKLLLHDDTESNYLVYCPIKYERLEDNWLYDIELYSGEPFYADKLSLQMDEVNIDSTPEMRKALNKYPKFFDNKERREKLKAFGKTYTVPYALHLDILSVLCSIQSGTEQDIISAVLLDDKCLENIEKFGNVQLFWLLVQKQTGYIYEDDKNNVQSLLAHILFTAASQTMNNNVLKEFDNYISQMHSNFCYGLVHDIMHSGKEQEFCDLAKEIEVKFNLFNRFLKLDIEEIVECDCFPCINKCILTKYLTDINDNIIKADDIIGVVEKRRTLKWYDKVEYYFEGLLQIAKMQQFYQNYIDAFHLVDPIEVWKSYTTELYKMDTYYRQFHLAFGKSLKESVVDIDDLFKTAADVIENLYQQWYLKKLTGMWLNAADEHLAGTDIKTGIRRQTDFYKDFIAKEKQTIFVIVSDALRYEVAMELSEELETKHRGKARLNAIQGVFPTITEYGMAALLSGRKKYVIDNNKILIDGNKCDSTESRKAVLCATDENSTAVTYKDFIKMKKTERSEIIKGKKVVYIYHNAIDAIGDKASTENQVFEACENAISELSNLVQIISGLRGSSKVIITADHGFLYTYSPLLESQKISKVDFQDIKEAGRRYVVGSQETQSDLLVPVMMDINNEDNSLFGFAPRDIVRIKMSGGGENFVHGGVSLQELTVPVIEFKNVRLDSKDYQENKDLYETKPVEIKLVNSKRVINNFIFTMYFLQIEPISSNRSSAKYQVFFADSAGYKVSDVQYVIADKICENPQERQIRCTFNLKSQKYDKYSKYYLIIIDENENEIAREEFEIDIVFAIDDFGF